MMSNINNLHSYKKAKVIVKDLEQVINAMDLSIRALVHFSKYIPVRESVSILENNKTLLEIHLNKQRKIIANKGEE